MFSSRIQDPMKNQILINNLLSLLLTAQRMNVILNSYFLTDKFYLICSNCHQWNLIRNN